MLMPTNPLVSIITPSYNHADFLEYTIQSVLKQEYEPIEYILVDGGSTDGSLEIIRRYADRFSWWISEPDKGQADAINKGFREAKGEIVAWLNSDDLYMPHAVSRAVSVFQEIKDLGMVYGDALTIDATGKPIKKLTFDHWGLTELIRFRIICQPTVFMHRMKLEKSGLLDPAYHFMLDHHLWIRLAQFSPVHYLNLNQDRYNPIAAARHHPTSKNVAQAREFGHEIMRILEWMENQSNLSPLIARNPRQVYGGAYRLYARYMLDGNMPWEALKLYGQAFMTWPGYASRHWHRMIYAALCLMRLNGPIDQLRNKSSNHKRRLLANELTGNRVQNSDRVLNDQTSKIESIDLKNWPGLCFEF